MLLTFIGYFSLIRSSMCFIFFSNVFHFLMKLAIALHKFLQKYSNFLTLCIKVDLFTHFLWINDSAL